MARHQTIRLVTNDEPVPQAQVAAATIIVTTDPEPFVSRFAAELGSTVHVFDNGRAVVDALHSLPCDRLFADYRQLNDRWNGLRFLKHVRERPEFAHIQVFLMADEWQASQERGAIQSLQGVLVSNQCDEKRAGSVYAKGALTTW